jgi:uncharacterized membrane protein (DUF4010 family)
MYFGFLLTEGERWEEWLAWCVLYQVMGVSFNNYIIVALWI